MPSGGNVPFVAQRVDGGIDPTVAMRGELDLATAPALSRCLESIIAERPIRIVLDFTDLTFMDVSGIAVLVRTKNSLPDDGEIVLRRPSSMIRRILTITGMTEVILIEDLEPLGRLGRAMRFPVAS